MATLMDRVTGGTQTPMPVAATNAGPRRSTRGRHRLSPNLDEVLQAKQGKHHNAKQPERDTIVITNSLSPHCNYRNY